MEVDDRVVAADQNPSPDGWINPSQQEVELEDFGGVIDLGHAEPSLSARQLPVSTRFFLVACTRAAFTPPDHLVRSRSPDLLDPVTACHGFMIEQLDL